MGLKVTINSLDDVEEGLQGFYKQSGDMYVLDVMNVNEHPAITGLSKTMREERDARKKFEKSLKDLQKKTNGLDLDSLKDVDLDSYKQQLIDLEKFKEDRLKQNKKKLKDKEQWEKLEQQQKDDHDIAIEEIKVTHQKQIDVFQTKLEELTTDKDKKVGVMLKSLESHLKDKEIISALAQEKGNVTVLMPHIAKHVKVIETDAGDYEARVIDTNGTPRITDTGTLMTISDFVTEMKEKPEFQGEGLFATDKQSGGSGSQGNQNGESGDNGQNPFKKDTFNLTQQMKLKKSNPAEHDRLQAAAG